MLSRSRRLVLGEVADRQRQCIPTERIAELTRDHHFEHRRPAVLLRGGALLTDQRIRIAELAARNRLPTIRWDLPFAEAGGLMSYGPSSADMFRRSATFVDKILKGAKPADLPIEQPTKFELVINLKTAKQIGLTIPPNVLVRADRVIR